MPDKTPSLTLGQRLQHHAAKALAGLPPRLQVRLSGRPAVELDGDTLLPEVQLSLALLERRRDPPLETLSPTQAREMRRRLAAVYAGPADGCR